MTSRLEQGSLVTVLGGSGFIGRHAVRALAREGWRIRAATRRPDLAGHLQPMGAVGQIMPVQANLRFPNSVRRAVEGAECRRQSGRHLGEAGPQTFQAVHVNGARAPSPGCARSRCKNVRACLGLRRHRASKVGLCAQQSGWRGGRPGGISRCGHPAAVARIWAGGPAFQSFRGHGELSPFLPLIGGEDAGSSRSMSATWRSHCRSVHRQGKARHCLRARRSRDHQLSQLARPHPQAWSGPPPPSTCACHSGWPKLGAALTAPFPSGWRPLTVDQVRSLQSDNIVSPAAEAERRGLAGWGVTNPHAMAAIVPAYFSASSPTASSPATRDRVHSARMGDPTARRDVAG